jgi:hypothetical protein
MLVLTDEEVVFARNIKMSDIVILTIMATAMVGYIIGWLLFH